MIVLHYIPSLNNSLNVYSTQYVESIIRATSNIVQSHILTEDILDKSLLSFKKSLKKKLSELNPDIVHIHSTWNFKAAIVEETARKKGIFTVVSPHGGLSPEIIELSFLKQKLPRIIAYQFRMIRKCHLIISASENEHNDLLNLAWKKRIILVSNPAISKHNDEDLSCKMLAAYRKMMDSHYQERITQEEISFIYSCLRASTWRENQYLEEINHIERPKELSFRRIYLFCHDHSITHHLQKGAGLLKEILPPELDAENTPRFKSKKKKDSKYILDFKKLCIILHKVIPEIEETPQITPYGDISLSTLTNIYTNIRFIDYDEDHLINELQKANMTRFMEKILSQLKDIFHLQTGFMPLLNK